VGESVFNVKAISANPSQLKRNCRRSQVHVEIL